MYGFVKNSTIYSNPPKRLCMHQKYFPFSFASLRIYHTSLVFPWLKQIRSTSLRETEHRLPADQNRGGRNAGRFTLPVKNTSSDEKVLKRRERLHAVSLTRDGRSLWCNRGVHCATLIPFGRIVSSESHLRWGPIHSLAITFACRLPTRRVWMALRGEPDLPFHSRSTRNVSQCQSWLKELFFELHVWYTLEA